MTFRWGKRRDRDLREAIADDFTYREAAAIVGGGCTEADARARMRALRAEERKANEIPERGIWHGSQSLQRPVIGPDQAAFSASPAIAKEEAGGNVVPPPMPPAPPVVRRAPVQLLDLPRWGEMEKTFDPIIRRLSQCAQ